MDRLGTVAILGVGLIGGSVGLALRARGLAGRVVGIGRDADRLSEAVHLGAIDSGTTDVARGLTDADVAVVCTPVGRIADDCRMAARLGPKDLLVTDAGSTKAEIVAALEVDAESARKFVGAHPIAGSERSGVSAATSDLFDGRPCVLTRTERTPADRWDRAVGFWQSLGCRIVAMNPQEHDTALAITSHLPHVVASALASVVPTEWAGLTGGAFRDGTRVAAADAALWSAIFLANREPILHALATFEHRLKTFGEALFDSNGDSLIEWWKGGLRA